jgi:hypothetical protein
MLAPILCIYINCIVALPLLTVKNEALRPIFHNFYMVSVGNINRTRQIVAIWDEPL